VFTLTILCHNVIYRMPVAYLQTKRKTKCYVIISPTVIMRVDKYDNCIIIVKRAENYAIEYYRIQKGKKSFFNLYFG